jgi:hypothetical protein
VGDVDADGNVWEMADEMLVVVVVVVVVEKYLDVTTTCT